MAYDTVTLTGTYELPNGTADTGRVHITPTVDTILDATGNVILGGAFSITLDAAGSFSVTLPATDDVRLNPTGFGYTLLPALGSGTRASTSFSLPASPATVDMADITSVDPATFTPDATYATYAQGQRADSLGTLAYAENATSTATTFNTTAVAIPGCVISIPATDRDVWVEWGCFLTNTGSTSNSYGPLYSLVYELTGGTPVAAGSDLTHKDLGMNYVTNAFARHQCKIRVGPSDTARIFGLYVQAVKEGGTTLSGSTLNSATGPSWIAAVAR